MTAFLSGEMRDTVELVRSSNSIAGAFADSSTPLVLGYWRRRVIAVHLKLMKADWQFFSRRERAKLFRRWPGASSMWVKVSPTCRSKRLG